MEINIIFCGALVAILYIGGYNITNAGGLKIGDLTAAITYITTILNGFLMLAMFFQSIVRGIASIKRLNMVLDCEPVVIEGNTKELAEEEDCEPLVGTVEFKDVSFSYPNSSGEIVLF